MLLGAALAGGLMVAIQVPWVHPAATARVSLSAATLYTAPLTPVAWPSAGSAAVVIPSLGVAQASNADVVPIASLTKLMTAYVALRALPLAPGTSGPCLVVNDADVAQYLYMKADGQSYAAVAAGERLCESDLLNGLLVPSANNYAVMLATMVSGSLAPFVARMNATARSLGLDHTHYVEPSGYKAGNVSTALEQAELAARLMRSALVRAIVDQPSVTLPVAGTLDSFTPDVGVDGVIGVKSGRTDAAGGCVAMAMTFATGPVTRVLYAVVLGQRGGDLLTPAGAAALALAESARANVVGHLFVPGERVATLGWGRSRAVVGFAGAHQVWWWAASGEVPLGVHLDRLTGPIHRGQVVGWASVHVSRPRRFTLVAVGPASPPTLWQRLR